MTEYTCPKYGNVLKTETTAEDGNSIFITNCNHGYGVYLDEGDSVDLALEILGWTHEVDFDDDGNVTLTKLPEPEPERPEPAVGQIYRVQSKVGMSPDWQDDPLVRIISVADGYINVETADGAIGGWSWKRAGLEGPLDPMELLGFLTEV